MQLAHVRVAVVVADGARDGDRAEPVDRRADAEQDRRAGELEDQGAGSRRGQPPDFAPATGATT